MKLQIIAGSLRNARTTDPVLAWLTRAARLHGGFAEVEVLDLRDWALPMFDESPQTVAADPAYSDDLVRAWNERLASADGFLFVTPEYNHSVPGALKNAIDSVYGSFAFRNKPGGFVGYSVGPIAAARAVEHLTAIAVEMELVPLRNTVLIPRVTSAFDASNRALDHLSDLALTILLDDLEWWANLLAPSRAAGSQLLPGAVRFVRGMQRVGDPTD